MKKYAVSIDISPSEQLSSEGELKVMSLLFGTKSNVSFDLVGLNAPNKSEGLELQKWSGSSKKYKKKLVDHLKYLKNEDHVIIGTNIFDDKYIRRRGKEIINIFFGGEPKKMFLTKRGKQKVGIRICDFDDKPFYDFELLYDELLVLGWYAHTILSLHNYLRGINMKDVKLDVIIDKLPLDVNTRKSGIVAEVCGSLSNELINVFIVKESDGTQRDLLTDNIAGLKRELLIKNDNTLYGFEESIFDFNWINLQ